LANKAALTDGWTRSDKAAFFDKDTLFDLVDGEAEAYFPYGFKGAVSAHYTQDGDRAKEAGVEIYEMGSLLDAFGIYSSMRDADSKPIDLGAEGFRGTTQIMFYAGRYFVKAQVDSAKAKGELLSFAKAVAAELPKDQKRPAELALVAIPNRVPRSEQFVGESVLGYAFWPQGLIAEVQAEKGTGAPSGPPLPSADVKPPEGRSGKTGLSPPPSPPEAAPARVFVVITDSPKDASTALDKYVHEVTARGTKIKSLDDRGNKIVILKDRMQEGVAVSQTGRYLLGAANLNDPEKEGLPLLRQLRRQVPGRRE
jgi:hypothetical protein